MNCLDNSHDHRGHGPYRVTTRSPPARSNSMSRFLAGASGAGRAPVSADTATHPSGPGSGAGPGCVGWTSPPLRPLPVRVVALPVLEGQDARVLDDPVADLDGASDRLVAVPSIGPGQHRPQVGQKGLADLPARRVP